MRQLLVVSWISGLDGKCHMKRKLTLEKCGRTRTLSLCPISHDNRKKYISKANDQLFYESLFKSL